mgnify:CR=1 FL=1
MQYMAVVECVSSGRLYIDDIISHGYRPLIVNTRANFEYLVNYRKILSKEFEGKVDFIDEDEDFNVFLNKIKKYDISAVFPGSEYGVRLAERLSTALGLRGNDSATTYLRTSKKGMYEALGRAGLRRIESKMVTCEDDIRTFWNDDDLTKCVVKYSESAGTVGLKICSCIEDAIEHYRILQNTMNGLGTMDSPILIQEYIGGTEYIVNTLSCDGKHMVTDIWMYTKVITDEGAIIYDSTKLVKDLEPGHSDMIQYAYKVLDAVEMKWGLCHTEIKIDKRGPVLIEVNARPMGLAMTQPYYDEVLGHHQTDLAIDVYLDPGMFKRMSRKVYNPPKYALMKLIIVPEDMIGSFAPTFVLSNMLGSTREILFFGNEGISEYQRTVDLDTSPLTVKMVNSDYGELMKDYEMLRTVEKRYFNMFYTLGEEIEPVELTTDIQQILENLDRNKKFVVVTDKDVYAWQFGQRIETDGGEVYDGAIYAKCGKCKSEDRYISIFKVIRTLRTGGVFIAVPESYRSLKYGSVAMDFMMNIGGVRILLPTYEATGLVYGIKK